MKGRRARGSPLSKRSSIRLGFRRRCASRAAVTFKPPAANSRPNVSAHSIGSNGRLPTNSRGVKLTNVVIALSSGAQTALIAAAASLATALVAGSAAAYGARLKIREIELGYSQKLHENYLSAARQYTRSIYVPLSIALTKLSEAFLEFRDSLDVETRQVDDEIVAGFRQACESFLTEIQRMSAAGADAFFTSELEEQLLSFSTFVRKSLTSTKARADVVFESSFGWGFIALALGGNRLTFRRSGVISGSAAETVQSRGGTVSLMGVSLSYRAEKLLEAPLTSKPFEQRMVEDLPRLKALIKEVTLGAHSGPPV